MPRRIDWAGDAIARMIARPAIAAGHGRRRMSSAHRPQNPPAATAPSAAPAAVAAAVRRERLRPTAARAPTRESTAGNKVSAASIVSNTAIAEEIASPLRNPTPRTSMPRSATITVRPANRTARPAVSIASITAPRTSPPRR